MTKQELLAHAHLIAAKAIREALSAPDAFDHLDITDAMEVKALADQLEGNHWRTARRLNGDAWPTPGSTR
jgi:hypothetical protein